MTEVKELLPGVYVLAVSGGVDSVALLDMLAKQQQATLIVTHVDHGIRADSSNDALFVRHLAEKYMFRYETTELHLGANAGEEQARHERYRFLQSIKRKYGARAIITAHHADDVVETMLINLLRGTGWRGLCSLRSTDDVLRPLLNVYKEEIIAYANTHQLSWHEDSTNLSSQYLRNYVRLQLLPILLTKQPGLKTKLHDLWQQQCRLRGLVEAEIEDIYQLAVDETGLKRHLFADCEPTIADEILRYFLLKHSVRQTIPQRVRMMQFVVKNGQPIDMYKQPRMQNGIVYPLEIKR